MSDGSAPTPTPTSRRAAIVVAIVAVAVAGALALALRLHQLALRPLHNDEAVNAVKLTELWEHGRYAYDPDEYHGPSLHYASLPFLWLSGARSNADLDDATLRWVTVAFGTGLILLLPLMTRGLGRTAAAWAALFVAVSPAMVFYSRYFIHELLLVFFTALLIGAGWRYLETRSNRWAVIAGAALGLMAATKETFVLSLAALGFAAAGAAWWSAAGDGIARGLAGFRSAWNGRHAALAAGAAFVVWLTLFSSFFTNWSGPLDSIRTYFPWLHRAGGHSPHIHPWYFYLERLGWFHPKKGPVSSEALILALAVVGMATGILAAGRRAGEPTQMPTQAQGPSPGFTRFLTLYTVALTAIYSVIPYKTPWCALNFHLGWILLAGVGASALMRLGRTRMTQGALALLLTAGTAQLGWQGWNANTRLAADPKNPYVYAQTLPDLRNLAEKVTAVTAMSSSGTNTVIKVVSPGSDYWPLPWSLRQFPNIGWYDALPDDPWAPIIIASSRLDAKLDEKSGGKWIMAGLFALRPSVFLELYVDIELWKKHVATLPRPVD